MKFKLILCGILLIVACSYKRHIFSLKAIEYIDNSLTINSDGTSETDGGSFKIIYAPGSTIYEVWNLNYEITQSTENNMIKNKLIPTDDTVFRYFIIKNKDKTGLLYKDLDASTKGKKFNLDSLLETLAINRDNMRIFTLNLGNPTKVEKYGRTEKVEKYFSKIEDSDADSIYRYYDSKLKSISFSFAPELDKLSDSKLYRTRFIYLPKTLGKPRQELITEIREVKIDNYEKVWGLINRFEDDYKTW